MASGHGRCTPSVGGELSIVGGGRWRCVGVFRLWAVVVLHGRWVISRGGAVVHMVGAGSWAT